MKDLDSLSTEEKLNLAKSMFDYEQSTGLLRSKRTNKILRSRSPEKDTYVVTFAGKRISQHRIVWLMHKEEWPEFFVRHRNGNKLDNKIENLMSEQEFRDLQHQQKLEAERTRKYRLLNHPMGDQDEAEYSGRDRFPASAVLKEFRFEEDPERGGILLRKYKSTNSAEYREVGRIQRMGGRQYRVLTFRQSTVMAHRISWVLKFGEWPRGRISFADGNTLNISPDNLLEAKVYRKPKHPVLPLPPNMEERANELENNAQEILTERAEQAHQLTEKTHAQIRTPQ